MGRRLCGKKRLLGALHPSLCVCGGEKTDNLGFGSALRWKLSRALTSNSPAACADVGRRHKTRLRMRMRSDFL